LNERQREQYEALEALKGQMKEDNPLLGFHACPQFCGSLDCPEPSERNPLGGRPKQYEFMVDRSEVVATNAGNRFGKTTAMVVWAIIQHTPDEMLPERLKVFKRPRAERIKGQPVRGRYLCPTEQLLNDTILPTFKQWMPKALLRGDGWDQAYRSQHNEVYFKDGGKLVFFTYKQDPNALAAATLDYVLWDEPPPVDHWRESGRIRTLDRLGSHRFGMTPVNMQGGGIGWIKREIWDRAKPDHSEYDPDISIHRGSIWDNPELDQAAIEKVLRSFPADERQAREHGDFIHFGGMIYPGGFGRYLKPVPSPDELMYHDVYVGIDPGLKNAAFVWIAFDNDNRAFVFDELVIKEGTPIDYARHIRRVNAKWSLTAARLNDPIYVIDPSARNRSLINRESVEAELARQGIFSIPGQNQVEAGVQQVRRRLAEKGLFFSEACRGLVAESDEYRMEDRPDGEFKVVKENDHRLDALRYALMQRPWYEDPIETLREQRWVPGANFAPSMEWLDAQDVIEPSSPPMGSLS
jgi:hypothetical protein